MEQAGNRRWSLYVLLLCMVTMAYTSFVYYPRWEKGTSEAAISYDVSGYYWYLPSIFIYHDLKQQSFKDNILAKYKPTPEFMQGFPLPNGNYVMKYSSGMAVMFSPFFFAAHAVAAPLGYPADGFSPPYQLAIQIGGFLIAMLGIFYFRKLLKLFFNDTVVASCLLILVFGTNYLNYSVIDVGMSHNWLFTIYVFILLNTVYFYRAFQYKYAIRLGLLIGLATLTRPTEAISSLMPLLWGLRTLSLPALTAHFRLLLSKYRQAIVAVLCALVVVSLQLFYWKYVSGHWIVYSYQDQHIYFRSPNFINYTFSYQSGWLLYTPMMLLAFLGIPLYAAKGKHSIAIITFFLLNYYLVCAWNIWWYGGRAMVQSYPVLMFPIALLVQTMLDRKWLMAILLPVTLLFFYINIWYTHQLHRGSMLPSDSFITKAYYWAIAGKWHRDYYSVVLLDNTEVYRGTPKNEKVLYRNDFETDTNNHSQLPPISGNRSLELTKDDKNTREYKFAATNSGNGWLKLTATVHCLNTPVSVWSYSQLLLDVYKGSERVSRHMYRINRLVGNGETKTIPLYMNVSGVAFDSLSVGIWNGDNTNSVQVDDIVVTSFN